MNNSILIAPLNDVQGLNSYPEFVSAMNEAYTMGVNLAKSRWGQDGPALVPGPNQFGICTPRKNDMANDVTDNTPSGSYRWTRSATATGWAARHTHDRGGGVGPRSPLGAGGRYADPRQLSTRALPEYGWSADLPAHD